MDSAIEIETQSRGGDRSEVITLEMVRERLSCALLSDALDRVGMSRQSPRVALPALVAPRPGQILAGRCRTTLWADMAHADPDPYALELAAVDACQPEDVLVCAAGGSLRSAVWGELLSTAARARGCVGVIVDGAARDVAVMARMEFPCFARGVSVYDSLNRQRVIDHDVLVEIDGVAFAPGDLVAADRDGVVVVPRNVEQQVLAIAWHKAHAENHVRDAIRGGMSATEAFRTFGVL